MAGYSGTPLAKKLGFKEGARAALVGAPRGFRHALGALPPGVRFVAPSPPPAPPLDLAVLFARNSTELGRLFLPLAALLAPAGALWVAWPKKSSGVATDLSFGAVQEAGLAAGLVDTKVCSVDETWSGLRFSRRLKDRV